MAADFHDTSRPHDWVETVSTKLATASGGDKAIDQAIAEGVGEVLADFTTSIDEARRLFKQLLPDWRLRLGYGATGMFPCATASRAHRHIIHEAPTVPIAILRAIFEALRIEPKRVNGDTPNGPSQVR